jgi:sugar phosphate isomerase/epimerase
MQLGISSWTYPWSIGVPGYPQPAAPLTALDLIDRARELGAAVVQVADNLPLHAQAPEALEQVRRHASERGVAVEVGTRGIEPAHLRRYLECARLVGARLLRTLTHTATSKPDIRQARLWLAEVLPEFERAGVVIALENNEAHRVREYAGLARELASPSFGLCIDTANSLGDLARTEEVLAELAPHAVCLHYKDVRIERFDHRMGFRVVGCAAGDGRVDGPAVIAELRRHRRDPNVIIEQWPPYQGSLEASVALENDTASRGIAYLRRLLAAGR